MADIPKPSELFINVEELIVFHNELAGEHNDNVSSLNQLKATGYSPDRSENCLVDYQEGYTVGFSAAVDALHAFIVARTADVAGKLIPDEQHNT